MIKDNNYTVYTKQNLHKQNEENMSPWQLILCLLLKPHVKSGRTDFGTDLHGKLIAINFEYNVWTFKGL